MLYFTNSLFYPMLITYQSFHIISIRAPDDAPSKLKMVYSSTKISFKNKLTGVQAMLQCNDLEELSYSDVFKNASK